MKLAAAGLIEENLESITPETIAVAAEIGLSGLAWSTSGGVGSDPSRWTSLRSLTDSYRLSVCEIGVYDTDFVSGDHEVSVFWLERVEEACEAARALGDVESPTVVVGCGSHNPAGSWLWDGRNFLAHSRERLTACLAEAGRIAESRDVIVALEGHVNTTACTPATAVEIVREAGSAALRVHLDPVNWITLEACRDTTRFLEEMFDVVGDLAGSCHAKDVAVDNRLITHMDEVPPGNGVLDYSTYMRLANPLDQWMVVEATPLEDLSRATAHLNATLNGTVTGADLDAPTPPPASGKHF